MSRQERSEIRQSKRRLEKDKEKCPAERTRKCLKIQTEPKKNDVQPSPLDHAAKKCETEKSANAVETKDETEKSANAVKKDKTEKSANAVETKDETEKSANAVKKDKTEKSANAVKKDKTEKSANAVETKDETEKSANAVETKDEREKSANAVETKDENKKFDTGEAIRCEEDSGHKDSAKKCEKSVITIKSGKKYEKQPSQRPSATTIKKQESSPSEDKKCDSLHHDCHVEPIRKRKKQHLDSSEHTNKSDKHQTRSNDATTKSGASSSREGGSGSHRESRDLRKVGEDIQILKDQNKYLEMKLKEQTLRERDLTSQSRALKEHYEIETAKIVRESKREAAILLSECKAKERLVENLQKALQKEASAKSHPKSTIDENDEASKSYSIPRPFLKRSASAAASIGRSKKCESKNAKSNLPNPNNNPVSKKDESRCSVSKKKAEISGKGSGPERRYVSKLEQMRRQIEEQQRQIVVLQTKLESQNPTLKAQAQLSASVPAIFEESECSSGALKQTCDSEEPQNGPSAAPVATASASSLLTATEEESQLNKGFEIEATKMASLDDLRCKSLDCFGSKFPFDSPPSLPYSSLASGNGSRRESELAEENEVLRAELQETRDHAELLEFRILEFTEGIQGASVVHSTCDQSTNTSVHDVTSPSPLSEDLSLPLSVDSGLELNIDISKNRLSEYRKSLSRLEEAAGLTESSTVAHLSSLLDWVSSVSGGQYEALPAAMSPRSPIQKKMVVSTSLDELDENICGSDLTMLAARLQETLANPKAQEEVLEETIVKLRTVNASLSRLQSRVHTLTQENKELQDALAVLHESHETRTEASGTESELVHGKTPSLHSDMSDTESDDSSRPAKRSNVETASSFQESGIFEASCEMVNVATQTGQESDEYLVAALEGEKVTLCKIEYDTIVANERSLQREIEVLRFERDQMSSQCASLEQQLHKASKSHSNDEYEVLRAELRLLGERLEISERQRKLYFEEKCEMEEAENDARLLSQRLESQLEAAREMESLLSASLSQEQEFCRELQRRVREMQEIDKGRRMHEEVLEKESESCRLREEALLLANDNHKSQLTFAVYGLVLAQFWRRLACQNKEAIVPFKSLEESEKLLFDLTTLSDEALMLPSFPCASECAACLAGPNAAHFSCVNDACTQTLSEGRFGFGHLTEMESAVDGESARNTPKALDRMSPPKMEDLSDREQFYLSQIEMLQKERKNLREDYENEQSMLIQQMQNMKNDLERLQQSLDDSQREKCKLLFKLEEAQTVIRGSEQELENQAKELKKEFSQSVEVYEQEQKAMQDQYEERMGEMKKNLDMHEQRFAALLQQYAILQHELEPYFQSLTNTEEFSGEESASGKILTTKDLLSAVRELVRSEVSVKQKLTEMEKKESAYRETINEADRIMSNHVTIYTRKIEELEATVEQKSSRIKQLEMSEDRLRSTMKTSWKSGEGARITELLDRLIETENSELSLKEKVWTLERSQKELQIKLSEAEKVQENLRSELRDQEELVQRLMTLSSENNALTSQLQEAHEATRRASDIQQSENYLKSRLDELETSESNLRDTLKQKDQMMVHRERKFRDQLSNLEGELSALRGQLELRQSEANKGKELEANLRHQIENNKEQIHSLEKELRESSSENMCHESQHRTEVTKLRSQLKLANTQLTDLDTLNGELKERLNAAESAMKEVVLQLEERSRRHESEVLSLNFHLSQKESKIEEFEAQLQQISHSTVAGELDFLTTLPILNLQHSLNAFVKMSKNCKNCNNGQSEQLETLNDYLKTLNDLINGRSSQIDSESEDFESAKSENLAIEIEPTHPTSPPNPAQEGLNETSSREKASGRRDHPSSSGETSSDEDKLSIKQLPSVPPRPRRDAKKVKKVRKHKNEGSSLLEELEGSSVDGGSFYGKRPASITILEELEEKVRELEEVVARKDEELRLADEEATDLHSRLIEEDGKLSEKTEEADKSNDEIESLRQQLIITVKEYEDVRQQIEDKHKVDMSELTKKVENLTEELLRQSKRGHLKDKIIHTLVKQIRCILRSGSVTVLVNQIRRLSREISNKDPKEEDEKVTDFDVDAVCDFLEQEDEVSSDPEAAIHSTQLDAISYQSLPSFSPLESAKARKMHRSASDSESSKRLPNVAADKSTTKACLASRSLPPLEQNKKSRIPRFRPLSSASSKSEGGQSLQEYVQKRLTKPSKSASSDVNSEAKQELRPLAKIVPKRRSMAKMTPNPKVPVEETATKLISDARKIKRMVTGLAPLSASVDCSSAPEWRRQSQPPTPSCVPRPLELRITRRVGVDGAVIAWKPLDHDCVAGFQVIVGGRVVQQVRSPHRTKALVTGLPFPSPFTIALVTVAEDGRCSVPAVVSHDRSVTYKPKTRARSPSAVSRARDKGPGLLSALEKSQSLPSAQDKGQSLPSAQDKGQNLPSAQDKGHSLPSAHDKGSGFPRSQDKYAAGFPRAPPSPPGFPRSQDKCPPGFSSPSVTPHVTPRRAAVPTCL